MRYLGRFASEGQVKTAILPLLDEVNSLELSFEKVEAYLLDLLNGTEFMPSNYETLYSSFEKLDTKKNGMIKEKKLILCQKLRLSLNLQCTVKRQMVTFFYLWVYRI